MDSDDEIEESKSWKGVPATIICINTYDRTNKSSEVAHAATCRMIRQCLRLSGSNFVGVCLYGTEVTNSTILGINSVEEVFPLKLPTLDDYRKLKNINITNVKQAPSLILSEVLWYCSRAFASCKRQLSSRNIILLSKLDTPPLQSDQNHTFKRVIELSDSNIDVKLINVSEHDYEIDLFYSDFLRNKDKNTQEINLPKPVWDKIEIEQLLHQQSHRHLAVARLSFEIGEDLAIGVGVYSLTNSTSPTLKKTDLNRDTNEILTRVNKTVKIAVKDESNMDVDEEQAPTPVPVLKSEVLHYKIFGGEKVQFTDDEMNVLKNPFGPPVLKLLGFKPASFMCKEKWFLKPCYFLFPNEDIIEGSFVAFKALHKACMKTNVVAFCVLSTRVNSKPMIVALSPTTKPFGLDVDIGFDIIIVPFVENVRPLSFEDEDSEMSIDDEKKATMKEILKKLHFDYKSDMFENPKVQTQYRAIEAKALDDDDDEEEEAFIDTTKPDFSRFQELQDDLFLELFGPFGPVAVKKPASSKDRGPAVKKPKQEINESLFQHRLDTNKLKDYTVAQLKDILYFKELPDLPALNGLKKNELMELVYKYCK